MPAIRSSATATRAPRKKATGPSDPCPICNKRVARQSDLKRHIDGHAAHEEKRFQCPQCPYRTNILCAYNAHADKHDGVLYPCPSEDCDKKFSDKASRSRHFSKFHKSGDSTKKARTSQTVNTVRKSRVPATVRREIKTEDTETYSLFSHFSSGAQLSNVKASEEQPQLSNSDSDSESTPSSTTTSLAPATPMNVDVGYMFNDQYTCPVEGEEVKFEQMSQDLRSQWRLDSACEVPSSFLDVQYPIDFCNDYFQFTYLPRSLQDFSCDAQSGTDYMYSHLQETEIPFAGASIPKEEVYPESLSGLLMNSCPTVCPTACPTVHPTVQSSTIPSELTFHNFDSSFYAEPSDVFNTWTQNLDQPLDFSF